MGRLVIVAVGIAVIVPTLMRLVKSVMVALMPLLKAVMGVVVPLVEPVVGVVMRAAQVVMQSVMALPRVVLSMGRSRPSHTQQQSGRTDKGCPTQHSDFQGRLSFVLVTVNTEITSSDICVPPRS